MTEEPRFPRCIACKTWKPPHPPTAFSTNIPSPSEGKVHMVSAVQARCAPCLQAPLISITCTKNLGIGLGWRAQASIGWSGCQSARHGDEAQRGKGREEGDG